MTAHEEWSNERPLIHYMNEWLVLHLRLLIGDCRQRPTKRSFTASNLLSKSVVRSAAEVRQPCCRKQAFVVCVHRLSLSGRLYVQCSHSKIAGYLA